MIRSLAIGGLLFSFSTWAHAERGCLTAHLSEAIELNLVRKKIYSQMTDGKSEEVSDRLIAYEKWVQFTLPVTGIESASAEWQTQGIPFLCEDFQASPNPLLPALQSEKPNLKTFKPISHRDVKKSLVQEAKAQNLQGVYEKAVAAINSINGEMRFNCMARHVLESIARIASQGLKYDRMAAEKNLSKKPSELTLKVLKLEIKTLYGAQGLDKMAAPFQAQGIPILCHDLPVIDWRI